MRPKQLPRRLPIEREQPHPSLRQMWQSNKARRLLAEKVGPG
jgi:hypothetical protein